MDELTPNELLGLANMLLEYSNITKHIERIKAELMLNLETRSNLSYVIKREGNIIHIFIPNGNLIKRLITSTEGLPDDYKLKLSKIRHLFEEI